MEEPSAQELNGSVASDQEFEPQHRNRCNTWPVHQPMPDLQLGDLETPPSECNVPGRRGGKRKNLWGNESYRELITEAILSSPDKRLTLNEIYTWFIEAKTFFKNKNDASLAAGWKDDESEYSPKDYFRLMHEAGKSAGWKNSVRHNLSLHDEFVKVPNEGTGKSNWWTFDPLAPKTTRRRTASMDTASGIAKRGRAKKKGLTAKKALTEATPSPSSSVSENPDNFSESTTPFNSSFQLSPDFRPRASSNASSCGRFSPIRKTEGEWGSTGSFTSGGSIPENEPWVPQDAEYIERLGKINLQSSDFAVQFHQSLAYQAAAPSHTPPICAPHRVPGCPCISHYTGGNPPPSAAPPSAPPYSSLIMGHSQTAQFASSPMGPQPGPNNAQHNYTPRGPAPPYPENRSASSQQAYAPHGAIFPPTPSPSSYSQKNPSPTSSLAQHPHSLHGSTCSQGGPSPTSSSPGSMGTPYSPMGSAASYPQNDLSPHNLPSSPASMGNAYSPMAMGPPQFPQTSSSHNFSSSTASMGNSYSTIAPAPQFPQGGPSPASTAAQSSTTRMGQYIGLLSNPTALDDLNITVEGNFEGVNFDDMLAQETAFGELDFNFLPNQGSDGNQSYSSPYIRAFLGH